MVASIRKKIVLLLILVFVTAVVLIIGAFNYSYFNSSYSSVKNAIYSHYRMLAENTGNNLRNPKGIHVVKVDDDGTLSIYKEGLPEQDKEDILTVAQGILATRENSGIWEHYQYENLVTDGQFLVAYMDISDEQNKVNSMVIRSFAIGGIAMAVWVLFTIWFSELLVHPMKLAMEKQREFMLMAGHELKTPITVISSSLELLKKNGIEDRYLDYAIEENSKMTTLVEEIVEISGIESNGGSLESKRNFQKSDLAECVKGGVLPFEASAFEKGVELNLSAREGIMIRVDESQIERLVGVLTDNAIKHTQKGDRVEVSLYEENGRAVLCVANQGEEIPVEEREKIFDRFYRVDKARNREEGRYGLGLFIASGIAKNHGAELTVDCRGGWTYFRFMMKIQ